MTLKQVLLTAVQALLEWFKVVLIGFSFGIGFMYAVKTCIGGVK